MPDKNIQMKHHDGSSWGNLFPKTVATITLLGDGRTVQEAITEINSLLDKKVDKVDGKTLTTNDFTDPLKGKLEGLRDHTADISNLQNNKADKSTTYTKKDVNDLISTIETGIIVSPNEPENEDTNMWFEEIGG